MKVISGGQTGADQGGLEAAYQLGIKTGGTAPKGWRTEEGARPDLGSHYGLLEGGGGYSYRTLANVLDSDGTVLFGSSASPGSKLTLQYLRTYNKPHLHFGITADKESVAKFIHGWMLEWKIEILNVAGNRESTMPGVFLYTMTVMKLALEQWRIL